MVIVVTIGDPEIVVCNCATGSDMDIGAAAIDEGGTAMVMVIVAPWGAATVAAGTGTAMLTTGGGLDPIFTSP